MSPASYWARAGTVWWQAMPGSLDALAQHDCVTSAHPSGRSTWRLTGPDGIEEEVQVSGRFSGNTAQALRKATLAGLGIALLPPAVARVDVQSGLLVPVLPSYQRASHGMSIVYPSRKHLPRGVSLCIEQTMVKMNESGLFA